MVSASNVETSRFHPIFSSNWFPGCRVQCVPCQGKICCLSYSLLFIRSSCATIVIIYFVVIVFGNCNAENMNWICRRRCCLIERLKQNMALELSLICWIIEVGLWVCSLFHRRLLPEAYLAFIAEKLSSKDVSKAM